MRNRALERGTNVCAVVALCGFALVANAQQPTEDTTPPPPSSDAATDEQPPAQTLPPCPSDQKEAAAPMPPPAEPAAPPPPAVAAEKHHNRIFAPQEISATTGAGAANYFGTPLNGTIDPGAAWNARLLFGTHSAIALEAGYVGSTNNIDMAGGGSHGRLDSHGFDTDLRLQLPTVVEPYVFGGVGYNHMSVTRTGGVSEAGPLSDNDNQVTVPAGAGVSGYLGKHTTLDLRGTYRYIPDNGLTEMSTRSLHQWVAQANIGYVF